MLEMSRRKLLTVASASLAAAAVLPSIGCSTSWIATAENDLPVIISIVESIVGIVADATGNGALNSAAAAVINGIATTVQGGLATLQQLLASYKSSQSSSVLADIVSALQSVQANLQSILTTAHVDNAVLQATIAGAVGLALVTVEAVESLLPAPPPSQGVTVRATAVQGKVSLPEAATLRFLYNSHVVNHGYSKRQI